MYMMYMVRKQLYLEKRQDKALKERAKALGLSEAEFVRQALDRAFAGEARNQPLNPQRELLEGLVKSAERISRAHGLPPAYCFNRDDTYREREDRLVRRK